MTDQMTPEIRGLIFTLERAAMREADAPGVDRRGIEADAARDALESAILAAIREARGGAIEEAKEAVHRVYGAGTGYPLAVATFAVAVGDALRALAPAPETTCAPDPSPTFGADGLYDVARHAERSGSNEEALRHAYALGVEAGQVIGSPETTRAPGGEPADFVLYGSPDWRSKTTRAPGGEPGTGIWCPCGDEIRADDARCGNCYAGAHRVDCGCPGCLAMAGGCAAPGVPEEQPCSKCGGPLSGGCVKWCWPCVEKAMEATDG